MTDISHASILPGAEVDVLHVYWVSGANNCSLFIGEKLEKIFENLQL